MSTGASRACCSTCRRLHNGQRTVTKRLPKQDIAKMIGASREMVSRVMKDLQMGGYIEMRGSTIVLRDTIMLRD